MHSWVPEDVEESKAAVDMLKDRAVETDSSLASMPAETNRASRVLPGFSLAPPCLEMRTSKLVSHTEIWALTVGSALLWFATGFGAGKGESVQWEIPLYPYHTHIWLSANQSRLLALDFESTCGQRSRSLSLMWILVLKSCLWQAPIIRTFLLLCILLRLAHCQV